MTPEKIDRYQVEGELGRGGMATVYKAYDPRFERHVAVKVLPREFMHDPEFRARFNREAKTIASLEHPAIVPVYDYGEDNGLLYLVMRFMPGGSLSDRLEKGPISIEESAEILQRLGSALDRAHGQGIIHRDLKPSNVLFDQYNDAFLADFGIVSVIGSNSNLTASGSLVGTPMYMSPEQVYGDKELDGRSDIYALGVILFQMLTGHLPYEADTPAKLMMKHILDPVPDLLSERPDLPPEAEAVVSKALAKERNDRFDTGADFSAALSTVTKEIPVTDELRKQLAAMQLAANQPPVAPEKTDMAESTAVEPVMAESLDESVESVGQPTTPVDQVPPELADDVLKDMGLPAEKGSKGSLSDVETPASGRNNHMWSWIAVAVVVAACMGLCAVSAFTLNQMNKNGVFAEMGTAVIGDIANADETPTTAAFPLLDPEDSAAATQDAALLATREQAALDATRAAENTSVENTPETNTAHPTEPADSPAGSPAEATRNSLIATRNAAAGTTPVAETSDLEATRDALVAARAAAAFEFPVTAVFGPADGELLHTAESTIEMDYAGVNLNNLIASATVVNPYPASEAGWDFGFVFRQAATDDELRLVVRSDGQWNLNDRNGEEDNLLQEGTVSDYLNVGEDGRNKIELVAFDDMGMFFLNGNLVAELDLSTQDNFGEVALGTGFYTDNKQEGAYTQYQDFTVWPFVPEFGPRDGELEHADDDFIRMRAADVELLNFITEASFVNPYGEDVGTWDWGFSFRELEQAYWLIVGSDGAWTLIDRRPDEDVYLDEGNLGDSLLTGAGEVNKLALIAVNDRGYFYLNDEFVAELDLSDRLDAGNVEVVAAFFEGNEVPGYTTAYNEFTVWPLP